MNDPNRERRTRRLRSSARLACLFLAVVFVAVPAPTVARSGDDATELKSLDDRLMPSFLTAINALSTMGDDINDMAARAQLSRAATAALAALDATDIRDCFRDWHALTRTAFWLLARSVDLIGAYDQATLASDNGARDAAATELGQAIKPGLGLFYYVPVVRQQVRCDAPTKLEHPVIRSAAIAPHAD